MKKISFKFIYKTALVCCLLTVFSCKKMFDVKPVDQVDVSNAYQNVYDANSAIIGIYGQFLKLADRYIVLNELRADLVSPTANADIYLKQLNTHTETTDNPWTDPKPWYRVILSINDAMYHFDDMLKTGKLKPVDYQQRYSDLGTLRCFLYLQLAAQYGTIPYVTDPLANITDLNDAAKFPRLTIDQLLPKLTAFMNDPVRYLDNYSASDPITGSTAAALNTSITDAAIYGGTGNSALLFVQKYAIAGDVNLWAGNYHQASIFYKYLSEYGWRTTTGFTTSGPIFGGSISMLSFEQYKVSNDSQLISYNASGVLNDVNANPSWREQFSVPAGASPTSTNSVFIWRMLFNPIDNPSPLVDLFANNGSGKYLLTASQAIINNWNSQIQLNGYPFDGRATISVRTINGQPVIAKHLYYYWDPITFQPVNPLQKGGQFLLYRSAVLQQHFAESALYDGQNRIAYALFDRGIQHLFNPAAPAVPATTVDITNTEQTFLPPPYDFDARSGGPQGYHQDWYRQVGSRNAAYLVPTPLSLMNNSNALEDAILNEAALETAFEGYRWTDLVRFARRR